MDNDSDLDQELDNSLVHLHEELDSSTEENRLMDDVDDEDGHIRIAPRSTRPAEEQVAMLEEMVQDMKQGLQVFVGELAKLQDRDDVEEQRRIQEQQQKQIQDLTETVQELKDQLNSVTGCLESVQKENIKLREDFLTLQTHLEENKGDGLHERPDQTSEWTDGNSENPFGEEIEEEESTCRNPNDKTNDEITAVACKSLSLTQALGEKCLHLNLSMSSEECDEADTRRLTFDSHSVVQAKEDKNRRHSLPASTNQRESSGHIETAANRRKAVKEVIESECDYCSQLWTLVETYFSSLQTTAFFTPEQLEILFPPYLEKLYEQHCALCSGLQDKLVHWSYLTVVSDLLSCITDSHNPCSVMSLYREYSENLPDAVNCLRNALDHSPEIKAFLKTVQQSSCQNDDLMKLIKAPAQHLPKHLLQLQQICKYTPSTHPDYLLLRTSLTRLRLFVEQINVGINNAMQTPSQDFLIGSSNESSQVASARDSGNLSNEDELLSARPLFKSEQCLISEDLRDHSYMNGQLLQVTPPSLFYGRQSRGGLPRHIGSNYSALSHPDLTMINSIPVPNNSPYSLSPSGFSHTWRTGVEGRQANNTNMKRMQIQQEILAHDPNHHLSRSRPSSAIDFTNGYNTAYPQHHFPGANYPRPRSAMGPIDSHHRPTIISRRQMRRSQPPLSNSGYWIDVNAHQGKHPHPKMPLPAQELLPSRPSPLHHYNTHDDDEEDDTRASDSISFMTTSSHRHSSGHGSNNGHDIDLEFQPLASDPKPYLLNGSKFTEDDVAARLAMELLSDDDDGGESYHSERASGINNDRVPQIKKPNKVKQQRVSNFTSGDVEKMGSNSNQSFSNSLQQNRNQKMNIISSSDNNETSKEHSQKENDTLTDKSDHDNSFKQKHKKEENIKETGSLIQNGENPIMKNNSSRGYEPTVQLKNQQFLLSLAHSPRSKRGPDTAVDSNDDLSHVSQSQALSQENNFSAEKNKLGENKLLAKDKVLLSHNSQPKVVRRSAPVLIPDKLRGSQPHERKQTEMLVSNNSSSDSIKPVCESSTTSAKPRMSMNNTSHLTSAPYKVSSDRLSTNNEADAGAVADPESSLTRSVDFTEPSTSEDGRERYQDRRRKPRNGDVDAFPRASDDSISARKKMHLKSSIKNLFSKKKLNESDV